MKHSVTHLRPIVALAMAVTLLAGCGSSGGPTNTGSSLSTKSAGSTTAAGPSTNASTPSTGPSTSGSPSAGGSASTVTNASAYCTTLGDYARQFKQSGINGKLVKIKRDLPKLVANGKGVVSGAPDEIKVDVLAFVADISALNTWIQTKATQKALDGSSIPPAIAGPFNDLQKRGPKLKTWYGAHCNGTFGG